MLWMALFALAGAGIVYSWTVSPWFIVGYAVLVVANFAFLYLSEARWA